MMYHVVLFSAIAFLPTFATAASGSACTNTTFPNFLNVGQCLNTSGDLCTSNSAGIPTFIGNLLQCTFQGIGTLNIGSQIYLTTEFLKYLLQRNDFGILLPLLTGVCNSISTVLRLLSGGIVNINCSALSFNNEVVCGQPIFISIPTNTPFAMCLNETGLTCAADRPIDEPALIGAVRVLACLVGYVFTTAPSEVINQVGCTLISTLYTLFRTSNSGPLKSFICGLQRALNLRCSVVTC